MEQRLERQQIREVSPVQLFMRLPDRISALMRSAAGGPARNDGRPGSSVRMLIFRRGNLKP